MTIRNIQNVQLFENLGDGYPLEKRSRDSTGLIMNVGGSYTLTLGGEPYCVVPGCLVFLRDGEQYRVELDNDYMKCYVVNFFCSVPGDFLVLPNCADLIPEFRAVLETWKRVGDDPPAIYDCIALVYSLYAKIVRRKMRSESVLSPLQAEHYRAALNYLRERFCDPDLTVSEAAAHCGISERWLNKIFSEACGKAPKECITELRIARAKELLSGSRSLTEVAESAGFRDVYQFSKCFHRVCGKPPRKYQMDMLP